MTGNSILEKAINIMHESDKSIYADYALTWVNITLVDIFDINNRIRETKNQPPLSYDSFIVSSMDETIKAEPELETAIIYGVLCKAYAEEENTALLNTYMQQYALEKQNADRGKMRFEVIEHKGWF